MTVLPSSKVIEVPKLSPINTPNPFLHYLHQIYPKLLQAYWQFYKATVVGAIQFQLSERQ